MVKGINMVIWVFHLTIYKRHYIDRKTNNIYLLPSRSASSIISCNSSSVMFSPNSLATRLRFLNDILPYQVLKNQTRTK